MPQQMTEAEAFVEERRKEMRELNSDWNKPVLTITGPFILGEILKRLPKRPEPSCKCRPGSPDACDICCDDDGVQRSIYDGADL